MILWQSPMSSDADYRKAMLDALPYRALDDAYNDNKQENTREKIDRIDAHLCCRFGGSDGGCIQGHVFHLDGCVYPRPTETASSLYDQAFSNL